MKKRLISTALTFVIICSIFSAFANNAAEWASEDVKLMIAYGIIPQSMQNIDYTAEIKREQFAELIYNAYQIKKDDIFMPLLIKPFQDTDSIPAAALYELGIINGDETGQFAGTRSITRQEAAKILCIFYGIINEKTFLSADESVLRKFTDEAEISAWARKYISVLVKSGIMGDLGDSKFHPAEPVTIQQAVVMISRLTDLQPLKTSIQTWSQNFAAGVDSRFTVNAEWNAVPKAAEYTVTVTEWRDTIHGEEIGARNPVTYTVDEPRISFAGDPNRRYVLAITGGEFEEVVEKHTPVAVPYEVRLREMEEGGGLPETQEEAEAVMQNITVNVWKLNSGEKVPSTLQITVHRAIADKMQQVFQEIFEGEEKFPIYSAGAYSWRGGRSEHNWGTAVDINPDENYCIYTNGTIVGKYWKPYIDPYSITPYGEVIRAFEKHGFTWGGDEWSGNRDFMHFSYLGT